MVKENKIRTLQNNVIHDVHKVKELIQIFI